MTEAGRITAIIDGDISALTSKLAQARSQATASVSGIESDIKGKLGSGLSGALSGGNRKSVGKDLGQDLIGGISGQLGSLGGVAGSAATALGPVGVVALAGVAGVAMLGSAASGAAMEWEAGMSQISKTTGMVKGSADFESLNSGLKDLYSTMPTTVAGIQGVAAAAGSLGIEKASIAGFTEVALQMGSAFDMPAEEAAVAIGKIKGQLKSLPEGASDSADFAMKFGSAVDYVGNNFNATEKDVLDFSTRVSGSMSSLGAGAYEVAGWGGMLSSVFPSAERAAGSFDSLLTNLTTNTDSQSKAAEVLGITTEEFMQRMTQDPSATLLNLGKAMEGLPTDKLMETAKTLGGSYGMDTLVKMVGHTEEWGRAIEDTVEAGKKGESIGTSFAAGADNMKSSLQVLKNSVGAILTDMGGPINAALTPIISGVAGGLNQIRAIGENLWEPMTAGLSPLTSGISEVAGIVGDLGGMTLDGLVAGSKGINTAFKTGKAFVSAFREELTKIIENSETFQTFSGYVDQVSDAFSRLGGWATETFDKIVSGLSDAIPTAISGVAGAVGTLMDKAGLGGVSDALGGVGDFLGNVYDNAMGKLGASAEDAVGEGTEKGMEKGAKGAKDSVAGAVEDAVSKGVNAGFDDAKDAFVKSGISKEIAGYMAAFGMSDTQALAAINSQSSSSNGDGKYIREFEYLGKKFRLDLTSTSQGLWNDLWSIGNAQTKTTGFVQRTYDPLKAFEIATGLPHPAEGTAAYYRLLGDNIAAERVELHEKLTPTTTDPYLDFADNLKDEMAGAGEEINTAFLEGLTPDTASIESRLQNIRLIKLYDPEESRKQGADKAIAFLTGLQSALADYEEAKATYLLEPDNELAAKALQMAHDRLQEGLDRNPLTAKVDADTSLFNTKMDNLAGSVDLKKLISDPAAFKASVMDIPEFMANTWQPAMQDEISFFKTQWHSGITGAQQETEDFLDAMINAANNMPLLFSPEQIDVLYRYSKGLIDVGQAIDALSGMVDKAGEKAKTSSVGWDELKNSMKECGDAADDTGDGLGCALSDFAKWQEDQSDLFQGSYIGQGGAKYLEWKLDYMSQIAETQAAMKAVGGAVLGEDYTQKVQDIKMKLSIDSEEAKTTITDVETEAQKER